MSDARELLREAADKLRHDTFCRRTVMKPDGDCECGYDSLSARITALLAAEPDAVTVPREPTRGMVDRFLAWPLPKSVCSDLCVTDPNYPHQRIGTNLLTADEAKQMIEHVLAVKDGA